MTKIDKNFGEPLPWLLTGKIWWWGNGNGLSLCMCVCLQEKEGKKTKEKNMVGEFGRKESSRNATAFLMEVIWFPSAALQSSLARALTHGHKLTEEGLVTVFCWIFSLSQSRKSIHSFSVFFLNLSRFVFQSCLISV